jgi:hypothetical protein
MMPKTKPRIRARPRQRTITKTRIQVPITTTTTTTTRMSIFLRLRTKKTRKRMMQNLSGSTPRPPQSKRRLQLKKLRMNGETVLETMQRQQLMKPFQDGEPLLETIQRQWPMKGLQNGILRLQNLLVSAVRAPTSISRTEILTPGRVEMNNEPGVTAEHEAAHRRRMNEILGHCHVSQC